MVSLKRNATPGPKRQSEGPVANPELLLLPDRLQGRWLFFPLTSQWVLHPLSPTRERAEKFMVSRWLDENIRCECDCIDMVRIGGQNSSVFTDSPGETYEMYHQVSLL
jgi:hypothetical protein